MDVYLGGASVLQLKQKGLLVSYDDMLILPNVTAGENWINGQIPFSDNEGAFLPVPSAYVSGRILVNSQLVDPTLLSNWGDLLKPEYAGKVGAHDPSVPGSGQAVATYLLDALGPEIVTALYGTGNIALTRDYRQIVDWAARGTYPIVIGALPNDIAHYRSQGITDLVSVEMQDAPGYFVGGGSVAVVPVAAKNHAAAAVFVNWYLSKNGQQAYSDALGLPSLRNDVDHTTVPEHLFPSENVTYRDHYQEDFYLGQRLKLRGLIGELLGE
jgi:ABC-type Fe3+ transport system substrate-binding protein